MKRSRVLWCAVIAAALQPAHAHDVARRQFTGDGPVSEAVFPPQQIPLAFSHVEHLTKQKLNCGFCHEDAEDSRSSVDNLIPKEESCAMCHDIDRDKPGKDCALCHPGFQAGQPVARVVIPVPNLKFNHEVHVEKKVRCQVCHGDLAAEGVGLATREHLPKMRLCLECHDGREAPNKCTTCHLAGPGGMLQTAFASGTLAPSGVLHGDDHDLTFRRDHARVAMSEEQYCGNCHKQEFCVGCHNGTVKPMDFHGNDYVTLHPIEARRNSPDCSACHRAQTFCVGCHSRSGVAMDGKGSEFLPTSGGDLTRRFHPPGWIGVDESGLVRGVGARDATHHSFEAQRNIRQCAACHREEFCTECHTNEPGNPFRINPHPANWRGSRRCKALAARAGRMCLRCHVDPSEVTCD